MNENKRLALSVFWVVLGLVLVVLSILEIVDGTAFSGTGGALMGIGMLQIIRNMKYRSNPEYKERVDIEVNDERNRYVRMKSWSWTGYSIVIIEAVGCIIALLLKMDLLKQYLLVSMAVTVLIYYISYVVINRKY